MSRGNRKKDGNDADTQQDTRVVNAGRDPFSYYGFVNPPVYHASTVLYPSAEDFVAHRARYQYGRRGTPTLISISPRSDRLSMSLISGSRSARSMTLGCSVCRREKVSSCRVKL